MTDHTGPRLARVVRLLLVGLCSAPASALSQNRTLPGR